MFQTFESQSERGASTERIKELRRLMAAAKLDAYLVPRADEHQGEYVPAAAARLNWLTGFSGSAGLAIVTKKTAVLFVDGRYTVQARAEVEPGVVEISTIARGAIGEWLAEHLSRGQTRRVRSAPAHHRRGRAPRSRAEAARHQAEPHRPQPRRPRVGPGAAAGADGPRRAASARSSPGARRRTRSPTSRSG